MRRGSSSSAAGGSADPFEEHADAPVELQPKEIDLSGGEEDKLPNTLVVTVIQARALQPAALRSTLSCYVKLSSLGREYKTSVISKSDEPFWNESFNFRAVDWASSVTLSVRDKINVKMRVLGHVQISSADIANLPGMTCQSWFRLRDKNGEKREGVESEIELKVALVYTKKNDPSLTSTEIPTAAATVGEQDDAAIGIIADQDDETEEEAFARRKELERQEKERKRTLYSNLKQGDYQIQVHVIEARDLKGENLSGTSDPYCQVDVMGLKKKTSTKYETLGCVFDEILFFHFKNIGRNELRQATIKIAVWDKEKVMKDNFIGAYHLDCLSVYFRPHHELYRQWIAIHDHMNEKDRGIQGFLLVSVNVIGPGDSFLVHDREAEVAKELTVVSSSPSMDTSSALLDSNQSIILMPPTIDLKLHFLLVKVFKAEDLPAMDEGGLVLSSGIDAFVQIGFAANSACKSSVVTVKGTSNLSPEFMEEMWIPVMAPTLSRNIVISVWDRDLGRKDEVVGICTHDYQQVRSSACPGGILASPDDRAEKTALDGEEDDNGGERQEESKVELRWFNLYGPPLRRVNKKRATIVSQNPEFGSTYRGRVLLSMEKVESPMPSESEKFHTKRIKDTTSSVSSSIHPATVRYTLRCALFCGADIPHYNSIATAKTKMRVTISIGSYEIHFDPQSVRKDGSVSWEQFKERWPIILPADLTQLPDVVVTLSRQLEKDDYIGVSFARMLAADFLVKGFTSKCEWIHLKEEISRRQTKYALDKSQSPGSLLLRIGFGREEVAVRHPWGDEVELFAPFRSLMVHREIRVHIFQFRKLVLPEEKTRLPNPFVSVTCCGQKKKTAPKYKTLDPLFYESLVFTVHVPQDVVFIPDLVFQLHDANVSTSTGVPSGVLGGFVVPMTKAIKSVVNANAPRPTWYNLQSPSASTSNNGAFIDEVKGEALVSIQYVDHTGPIEHLHQLDSLTPEYEDANLEIAALGVRRLKALSILGVQHPYMEFELIGGMFADGTSVRKSKPSATTSNAKNANFLDFMVCPAKLPVDTLYAPQLRVKVCESSLGGLRKATIASCVVDLCTKLPWSVEYVPPQQQRAFENPAPAPAFISSIEPSKMKHKMRFPVLKISKQRKATGIQDVASDDGIEGDDSELLSGDDEDSKGAGEVDNGNEDDGIGIGELKVPRVSLPKSTGRGSRFSDPALLRQMQNETQRRYIAARADMLQGGSHSRERGEENTLHDVSRLDTESSLKPASYMDGRDWWITEHGGEELENFLKVKALETYPLYRSVLTRPSLLKRKRVRSELRAGIFKGLILVTERAKKKVAAPMKTGGGDSLLDLERLQEPQSLIVRVYVLRGSNLQSKDSNGYSDPYLRLKLGKHVISDRVNYKKKTLNPEFFQMFTFNTSLPGPSQLEIGVWDHDLVMDEFIGATTIDLEDRWFHKDWQRIGQGHPKLKDAGGCLKPIEYRHLYTPKRTTSQGFIQLWIDILTSQQAAVLPPVSIEPPSPKKFEVRVVVWRAENITDKDNSEVNDYFVKAWMEGGKTESTDVHWRCSNGKPCWNWRFKLPVEYPLRTSEFGRLHIQLWDKDVLKWNDILGEAQLDLYKWIRRAYESNRAVSPFLELKAMANTNSQGSGYPSNGQEQGRSVENELGGDSEMNGDGGDDSDDDSAVEDFSSSGFAKESHSLLRNQKKKKSKEKIPSKAKLPFKKPGFLSKPSADSAKKAKQAKEQAEAKAALNGLLDFLGLGALPDDAEWITIYYTDRESAVSMDMGRIGISVQIVPEQEAQANPVGKGQEAPNLNPYLPPPVGRMRLSANPVMMLKELIGPKMCMRITILYCCVGCAFFIAVFGATIMSTLTYIQGMSNQDNGVRNWRLPNNMRFPPDFQDPKNTSVLVGEV